MDELTVIIHDFLQELRNQQSQPQLWPDSNSDALDQGKEKFSQYLNRFEHHLKLQNVTNNEQTSKT